MNIVQPMLTCGEQQRVQLITCPVPNFELTIRIRSKNHKKIKEQPKISLINEPRKLFTSDTQKKRAPKIEVTFCTCHVEKNVIC